MFSANDEIARPQVLKNVCFSEKKLLNAILRAKAQTHEKGFFLMKLNVFCNAEDRFSSVLGVFAEKVILELNCTKLLLLELLRSTNSVFSANDEIARPRMLKNFCFSEKKLLNAILRAKLKNMKNASF